MHAIPYKDCLTHYLQNSNLNLIRQSSHYSLENLYGFEGESAEEWMGRLRIAVAKCNYKEIDRQLKEQFIHGLNNKAMLG